MLTSVAAAPRSSQTSPDPAAGLAVIQPQGLGPLLAEDELEPPGRKTLKLLQGPGGTAFQGCDQPGPLSTVQSHHSTASQFRQRPINKDRLGTSVDLR